jgi:hypothetical protein
MEVRFVEELAACYVRKPWFSVEADVDAAAMRTHGPVIQ